jgi:hypothetical protein
MRRHFAADSIARLDGLQQFLVIPAISVVSAFDPLQTLGAVVRMVVTRLK